MNIKEMIMSAPATGYCLLLTGKESGQPFDGTPTVSMRIGRFYSEEAANKAKELLQQLDRYLEITVVKD